MAGTNKSSTHAPTRDRKPLWIALGVVAVIAVLGIAGLVWYLNRPVPDEVSLEGAVADVSTTQSGSGSSSGGDGLDGVWVVDTSVGDFSFEEATSSFVGFRIEEELTTIGTTTAVGRTPVVHGTIDLSGASITDAVVEADLTAIVTNADRRNRAVQRALNTSSFPTATFTLTGPIDLGSVPVEGEPVSVTANGDLTINGVTRPLAMPLDAQLIDDLIVVVGSADITFSDWNVSVPSAPVVVSAEDHGILELQLFFGRG